MSTQLSPHFTLEELERNQIALRIGEPNKIPENNLHIWIKGCQFLLEPIRLKWVDPLYISCGYRSPRVNDETHGASVNSSHRGKSVIRNESVEACAFDIDLDVFKNTAHKSDNLELFHFIRVNFQKLLDQLIYEYGWVHVGYIEKRPRNEVLIKVTSALRERYKIPSDKNYIRYFEGVEI